MNSTTQQPPFLNLFFTPNFEGPNIIDLGIQLVIERPNVGLNQTLIWMDLATPDFPVVQYSNDAIDASDDHGKLPLVQEDDNEVRNYNTTRPTNGDVILCFTATPNQAPNSAPIHDFRLEGDGLALLGAGKCFIPIPNGPIYTINLSWDLAKAPTGTTAVSSLGEGTAVTKVGAASSLLAESYFAVGQVRRFPPPGTQSNYSMYWFTEPPFDLIEIALWTRQLFENMQLFFLDEDDSFRVFARQVPALSTGGATLTRSFLFTFGSDNTVEDLEILLSHEMVHNWLDMTGSNAETTWYIEGIADYYSARLPFLFGMRTVDQFIGDMNSFARNYYSNPSINVTNEEQAKLESSAALENLPYARGTMFLVRMDAAIRAKTSGTRSLDNVVLALLDRSRKGLGDTVEDFIDLMVQEIGTKARQEYQDMANGIFLIMPEGSLGPCFSVEKTEIPIRPADQLPEPMTSTLAVGGFMAVAYQWRKKLGALECCANKAD